MQPALDVLGCWSFCTFKALFLTCSSSVLFSTLVAHLVACPKMCVKFVPNSGDEEVQIDAGEDAEEDGAEERGLFVVSGGGGEGGGSKGG